MQDSGTHQLPRKAPAACLAIQTPAHLAAQPLGSELTVIAPLFIVRAHAAGAAGTAAAGSRQLRGATCKAALQLPYSSPPAMHIRFLPVLTAIPAMPRLVRRSQI
jgi:hypothetical protein